MRTILAVSGRQLACAVWTAWWLAVLLGDDVDAAARRDPLVVPGVGYVRALSGGSCAVVAVDAAAARGVVLAAFCRWLAFVAGARALVSGGRMADAVRRCASRACDAEERSSASLAFTVWRALVRANADGRERRAAGRGASRGGVGGVGRALATPCPSAPDGRHTLKTRVPLYLTWSQIPGRWRCAPPRVLLAERVVVDARLFLSANGTSPRPY